MTDETKENLCLVSSHWQSLPPLLVTDLARKMQNFSRLAEYIKHTFALMYHSNIFSCSNKTVYDAMC